MGVNFFLFKWSQNFLKMLTIVNKFKEKMICCETSLFDQLSRSTVSHVYVFVHQHKHMKRIWKVASFSIFKIWFSWWVWNIANLKKKFPWTPDRMDTKKNPSKQILASKSHKLHLTQKAAPKNLCRRKIFYLFAWVLSLQFVLYTLFF